MTALVLVLCQSAEFADKLPLGRAKHQRKEQQMASEQLHASSPV